MSLDIVEIFRSIDGEGVRSGLPTIFIRFCGCNMRCTYCDSVWSQEPGQGDPKWSTVQSVVEEVIRLSVQGYRTNITITGGEPLLYEDEIIKILEGLLEADYVRRYSINIETNGTRDPSQFIYKYNNSTFAKKEQNNVMFFTFDLKTESAGLEAKYSCIGNDGFPIPYATLSSYVQSPSRITPKHIMKVVVGSVADLDYAHDIYMRSPVRADMFDWYISPCYGKIELREIIEYILSHPELTAWRAQIQLHKVAWDPDMRGV